MVNKKSIQCPLEDVESEYFDKRLKLNDLENSGHIPNETRTPYMWTIMKNKRMGVSKWIPDFLIVIPKEKSVTWKWMVLFVEMKRQNWVPSDVKPEQRRRLAALQEVENVETFVWFWFRHAAEFVSQYLHNPVQFI